MINFACPDKTEICRLRALEPWLTSKPWTKALENKKVLIVHPYVETMRSQYQNRKQLFGDLDILPDFDIDFFEEIQTGAGKRNHEFKTWFHAYDYMINQILKRDFEIVILGLDHPKKRDHQSIST